MQSVEEQANATDSTLSVSGHVERGETPACRHILSLARSEETFYICGHICVLAILLREISKGFACGSGCELDSSSAIKSGQVWSAELYCKNGPRGEVGKLIITWEQIQCELQVRQLIENSALMCSFISVLAFFNHIMLRENFPHDNPVL